MLERRTEVGFVGARSARLGLRYVAIGEDELVLAIPATHPVARCGRVRLAELEGQPFVERAGGSGTSASLLALLEQHGLAPPPDRVVMTDNTIQAMLSAIARGRGLGFRSSLALADRVLGTIAGVRLAGLDLRRRLYLVDDDRRPLSPAASTLVALRKEAPA